MAHSVRIRQRTRLSAEERRAQIVDAATSLISARGYWGLSLQDVADATGLTVNGVLHHVHSKDGLLLEVLNHRDKKDIQAISDLLEVSYPDGGMMPDDLVSLARARGLGLAETSSAIVARNARQPEIVRLYSVLEAESLSPDHPAHDYFSARQRLVLDVFARLAPPEADAQGLARHLLATMDGLQLQWLRDPSIDLVEAWSAAISGIVGVR